MAKQVKRILATAKKNKRKNNKLQYVLTLEKLLKSGFHFGGDSTSPQKDMNPFIVGKSKARARFKVSVKKGAQPIKVELKSSKKLSKKAKTLQKKALDKVLKEKRFSHIFTHFKKVK